jgi:uncharacterized peroxidase-related enzyme
MSRIALPRPEAATGPLKDAFDAVRARFGAVPNGVRTLGVSPEALSGFLSFATTVASGALTAGQRERIAVLTAQHNRCGYCLSAHTLGARAAGVSDAEIAASRAAKSEDARTHAILAFANAVLMHKGGVGHDDLRDAQDAKLSDAELVEIVAEVTLSTFTNYVNRLIEPDYDIPAVPIEQVAAV